ncbi:hypothetical protein [Nonomuraea sp. NPDC050691]|uniref:hypothetical protein n=1 Tax=Nonomuraea sp. NPDC050691 TaxID=3155661 RepID=UPI0033C967F6
MRSARSAVVHEFAEKVTAYFAGHDSCAGLRDLLPRHDACAALLAEAAELRDREGPVGLSHVHRNGFTKLCLLAGPAHAPWRLRLHIWDGPARDPQIHDHRWCFSSRVLAGELMAFNYDRVDSGTGWFAHRLHDADADGRKKIERAGQVALSLAETVVLKAGRTHDLHYELPHLIEHERLGMAATLVLTAPAARGFSHGYNRDRATQPTVVPPTMIPAGDVGRRIHEFLERFACSSPSVVSTDQARPPRSSC